MGTRFQNRGPGAMTGVSQIQAYMHYNKPLGPSSAEMKRVSRKRKAAGSTPEISLHRGQMQHAWAALCHPEVRMCYNELTKRLFSGDGIVVYHNEAPRRPSAAFRSILEHDFVPFVRNALDAIMVFGVVPIVLRRVIGRGLGEAEVVPEVPKFGTYIITTWSEGGTQRFRFYWSGAIAGDYGTGSAIGGSAFWTGGGPFGDRDDSVMIAHNFGFDPNINGTLMSNMHVIAQQLAFMNELKALAVTAERIAANPPLITAYNSAIEDRAEDTFGENFYVGNGDMCVTHAEAVYERNAQQQALFRENMRMWEENTGLSGHEEFGVPRRRGETEQEGAVAPRWARDWRGAEMPWSRQYYLDTTRQLVQQQLPRPRGDLVNLMSQSMDIICGVLNVPRGMLASDSHVRAGVEAVAESMHHTVNRWASILSGLMTAVYDHTFGKKDLRDELRIRWERRRRTPLDRAESVLTEQDLFEAEAKTRIRLGFDLAPVTTPERLDALYNRGLVTWQTYGQAQLRLHGFRREQLASPKDPLSKADQRELLLGPKKPDPASSTAAAVAKKPAASGKSDAGQDAAKSATKSAEKGGKGK